MSYPPSCPPLLVTTFILSMLGVGEAMGTLVYPPWDKGHPTDGNPYTTIAAGLEATNPGGELQVMPGTHKHDVEAIYVLGGRHTGPPVRLLVYDPLL